MNNSFIAVASIFVQLRKDGWRVKHIFSTKSLSAKAVNSGIDTEPRKKTKLSDHTVLAAEFELEVGSWRLKPE